LRQQDKRNEGAFMVLAYLLGSQKRFAESQQYFEAAIRLAPGNESYVTGLAALLLAQGKTKEAKAVYINLEKTFHKNVTPYLCLAEMAKEAGNLTEYEALLRQATKVKPTSDAAWRALAEVCAHNKKTEESLKYARRRTKKKSSATRI
jgi:predicted Zn-dependent protease